MASGFPFALLLCLSVLLAAEACPQSSSPKPCCSACPAGWTQFGSKCFLYHRKEKNWWESERTCLAMGGNLASILSEEEHDFVREYMNRVSSGHRITWVGGNDGVKEGFWVWNDGAPFKFERWATNEPNNLKHKEHCLQINWKGDMWNDMQCKKKHPSLCSMDLPCCDDQHKKECH